MCIIFFIKDTQHYKFIVAANRDEFLDRPSLEADFWKENSSILGGIDLGFSSNASNASSIKVSNLEKYYGTWMGISKNYRFAFLTNKRQDPKLIKPNMRSRGLLVKDFLLSNTDPITYCNSIIPQNYNGYFLVVGNLNDGMYLTTNDQDDSIKLYSLNSNRIYGLSNGPFKTENSNWPKVEKGKRLFKQAIENFKDRDELVSNLFSILKDSTFPKKEELPDPIYNSKVEYELSSICVDCIIDGKLYGTRTHTVILVDKQDNVYFEEIDRFKPNSNSTNIGKSFEFKLDQI